MKNRIYGDSTPETGKKVPAMARPSYSAPAGVPAGSSPRANGGHPSPASRPPSVPGGQQPKQVQPRASETTEATLGGMNPTDRLNPDEPLH